MDLKKSNKANLEKRRGFNLFLGLIIALSLILISFEWTTMTNKLADVHAAREIPYDKEMMQITRRNEVNPPPIAKLPDIKTVIMIVEEDPDLGEFIWETEYLPGTEIVIPKFEDDEPEVLKPEDTYYPEIWPRFNGGDPQVEFYKYIVGKLNYPAEAVENRISGRVIVKFVVSSKGYVERAEVIRGVHPSLDKEALRVINSSPKWEPGFQSNRYVNVIYLFPINFVLQ
ncbi:MAG: energy transducer TonB [Bacteroidota bacterium]